MPETILITGAGGAIGKATARRLASDGYALLALDREAQALAQLQHELPAVQTIQADATDGAALRKALADLKHPLAGAVLAAGIHGPVAALQDCADEDFQAVMHANVMSVWVGLKAVLPLLTAQGRGSVVVLSSISGVQGMPLLAPYCASKHAVQGLVKTAAREVAKHGVRVNAIAPGPVASPMMSRIDDAYRQLGFDRSQAEKNVPLQRYAAPEDVAAMVSFLCAPQSAYCTGATMSVDGGLTCR